ncbi:ABC transporter substrate-binding protein [Saccharopolyspora mangrovi]|uniref:ABC transporter substrate-binding protein n=1 Tax=Saccharopolyspora mangrovi TaxID=3082379 RepID=A0ABU6AK58_9PSEU|nr:ABC transporter substrate-binding protein [Saccharopolyspora sp. S2-29]MEB3371774.1 ABC transporter substrate-binding protein [Saccharopolyspora sp. S2-29]
MIDLANSRAIDDRTVEFRLKRPYAEFPNALATLGAYIIPEGTTDFSKPIGSGPFKYKSFEPGRAFLGERNPGYFDGAPLLDELEIVVTNDEAARVNALLGKQVEYANDLTLTSARTYEASGQIRVLRLPLSNFHGLAMRMPPPGSRRPRWPSATRRARSGSTSTCGWATRTPTGPTSPRTAFWPATARAGCRWTPTSRSDC